MHNNLINLLQSADVILNKNSGIRANGNVASFRTQHHSKEVIHACCKELHELGFYLENVSGIKEKHIKALIENWNKRTLAISTMRENFSRLKQFCVWAKKEGIIHVHGLSHYLPYIDKTAADKMINKSKSWSGNGVDVIEKIMQTKDIDERWHLMLLMGLAFGLRRKEMLCIKPWSAEK
jgi:site-specific recombinase XerD